MKKHKIKFGATLAILAIMMVLSSACGSTAEPTPTPTPTPGQWPGGNQPPVISSLTAAQTQVLPADIIELRCEASDPDGDTISYEWSADGGKFTGNGQPVVSWIAPEQYGTYNITITVDDSKEGITQENMQLSVVANRNPVITSLVANSTSVLPLGQSIITCIASDPDGDNVNYGWTASDGSITGVGNTVTWIAPDREGTFTVTVTVDDGHGGQNVDQIDILASLASTQKIETFNPIAEETGTVSSTGDRDVSRIMAGDDENNVGYHAFLTFDLYSLRSTDVKEATLTFTRKKVVDDPFSSTATGLHGLHLWIIRSDPGQLPDYNVPKHNAAADVFWEPPTTVDVTSFVRNIGQGITPIDRLQFEARFLDTTNGNKIQQYIEWEKVTLTVTYVP
ncbi:MAG: PKD domain-containing protein [Dehalococcoidia bacterium]|nr:PKD domain-containing protein [Dehalococcoidia bacterium]